MPRSKSKKGGDCECPTNVNKAKILPRVGGWVRNGQEVANNNNNCERSPNPEIDTKLLESTSRSMPGTEVGRSSVSVDTLSNNRND